MRLENIVHRTQRLLATLYFQCTILRQVVAVMGAGIGKSVATLEVPTQSYSV
jgi:hypothetical protein